jgi:hypothetical protein
MRRRSHLGVTVGKAGYIWAVWESNYPIRPGKCAKHLWNEGREVWKVRGKYGKEWNPLERYRKKVPSGKGSGKALQEGCRIV